MVLVGVITVADRNDLYKALDDEHARTLQSQREQLMNEHTTRAHRQLPPYVAQDEATYEQELTLETTQAETLNDDDYTPSHSSVSSEEYTTSHDEPQYQRHNRHRRARSR